MKPGLVMIGLAVLFPALTWVLWQSESPVLQAAAETSYLLFYFFSFALGGIGFLILAVSALGRFVRRGNSGGA